jgi:serine/threonine-protein kinase HipA
MSGPQPVLTGAVGLSQLVPNCATFSYAADWWQFALSEDLPLIAGQTFSAGHKDSAPGAIDDARPDRWGERIIRHIDRPARLSILEMLLFAGDDRFGALGISTSADHYIPRRIGPYPQLRDLGAMVRAVEDVQSQAPVTTEIQRLVQPGVTLGGARPKALLQTDRAGRYRGHPPHRTRHHDAGGPGGHPRCQHGCAAHSITAGPGAAAPCADHPAV